jgi:hypothetical protein
MYFRIGKVHLLQSRAGEAITWLEKARSASLGYSFIHAFLAAAYGLNGDPKHAATELAEARRCRAKALIRASHASKRDLWVYRTLLCSKPLSSPACQSRVPEE